MTLQRHVEGREHQVSVDAGGHGPADDAPTEEVQHDSQVQSALARGHVSDVRHPSPIGLGRMGQWRSPEGPPTNRVLEVNLRGERLARREEQGVAA